MKIATFFFVFFASSSILIAQDSLRHVVHFDSDKHEIRENEQEQLLNLLVKIDTMRLEQIILSGHTDSDGSDEYNQQLSAQRVVSVRDFLLQNNVDSTNIQLNYFGEDRPKADNAQADGKRENRRVEVQIIPRKPDAIWLCGTGQIETKPDCSYDTTLIYPQGTEVTMNICDYHSIKDCFEFREYNTGESLRNSNLTTQTADGTPLISGGMFEVDMCKDVEIEVNIPRPINPCDSVSEFKLWTATNSGAWERIAGRAQNIRRNGRNFLRTVVSGVTKMNMDVIPARSAPIPKMIVKVPRKYTITKAKLSSDTPVSLLLPYKTKRNKSRFVSICMCSEPLIYLEVRNRNGEIDTINFEKLNEFDTHESFGKCKTDEVVKKILFFKVRKKGMYRKYLIRKKDFGIKE